MPVFYTKYNAPKPKGEDYTGTVSLCQPGRSESIEHLVQRLTRKPNPTAKDLLMISPEVENASELSDQQIDERLMQADFDGADKADLQDALQAASEALEAARVAAQNSAKEQSEASATTSGDKAATASGASPAEAVDSQSV